MSDFRSNILTMVFENSITPDTGNRILNIYDAALESICIDIRTIISNWEQMDPNDIKLYSLGLRHALDFLDKERSELQG